MNLPTDWSLGAPWRLLLLLVVAALVAAQLWRRRRRSAQDARFTQVALLASVLPRSTAWRRRLPAGLLLGMLVLLTTALARPSAAVEVERQEATVVLALDTSSSMLVEDIAPTRIEAAKAAAKDFVDSLPDGFAVGLVSFNRDAAVVSTPTRDHAAVNDAIDALTLRGGTAIGSGVEAAISAARQAPVAAGEEPAPVTIVLLSDGINARGTPLDQAAQDAVDAGYPVSTIAYGSDDPLVPLNGELVAASVDATALAELAEATGGTAYRATSGLDLQQVYDDISSKTGTTTEDRDLTATFLGVALAAAMLASAVSLLWFRVLP